MCWVEVGGVRCAGVKREGCDVLECRGRGLMCRVKREGFDVLG